jgi:hypothetical protein
VFGEGVGCAVIEVVGEVEGVIVPVRDKELKFCGGKEGETRETKD